MKGRFGEAILTVLYLACLLAITNFTTPNGVLLAQFNSYHLVPTIPRYPELLSLCKDTSSTTWRCLLPQTCETTTKTHWLTIQFSVNAAFEMDIHSLLSLHRPKSAICSPEPAAKAERLRHYARTQVEPQLLLSQKHQMKMQVKMLEHIKLCTPSGQN